VDVVGAEENLGARLSLKRIGVIRFQDEPPPDYWAERGYDWYAGL
jgi:hypothetical protein